MENNNTYNFIKQSVKGGAIYSFWGNVQKVIVVTNVFFILKYLSLYQYGVYKLAFSVYFVFSGFLLSGLDGLVLNDASDYLGRKNRPSVRRLLFEFFLVRVFLGILAWAILFFGSELIVVYYNANVAAYIKILSFLYLTDTVVTLANVFYKATLNFFISAIIPVVNESVKFIIIFYLVFVSTVNLNITNILWMHVLSAIITCLLIIIYSVVRYRDKLSIPKDDKYILFKSIKTYGKWALAKSYFVNIPDNLRVWFIKIFISTEAVAIFSVAQVLLSAAKKLVPSQFLTSIVPMEVKDMSRYSDIYKRVSKYYMWFYFGVGVLAFLFVPIAVKILFPKYIVSLFIFKILLISLLLQFFTLSKITIYSLRRQKFLFIQPFINLISVFIFSIILIPAFALKGVATEYIFTSLLLPIINYIYLIKHFPELKMSIRNFFIFDYEDRKMLKNLFKSSIIYFKKNIKRQKMKKTIFITSFHPLISRNIFSSGLLKMLSSNNRVVILVPNFKKDYFIKEYSGSDIIIEGVANEIQRRDILFRKLFLLITPSKTLRIKHRAEILVEKKRFLYPAYLFINSLLGNSKYFIKLLQSLDCYVPRKNLFQHVLDKYKPNLVFSTDVQSELDVNLMQEAKKLEIKTIGMIRSWDNVTTKGLLRIIPDYLIVNNTTIKKELVKYNFINNDKILVVGIPHYDNYQKKPETTREDFYKSMDFDLNRKILLFAPVGNRYIKNNKTDVEVLKVLSTCSGNILVRLPPGDDVNFDSFKDKKNIYFDRTGSRFWKSGAKSNEISKKDEEHLIDSLYYSDILICGPSTMCIDAAIFNKPIVLINFDDKKRKYYNSISRYFDYNHMLPILESKGVKIADSREDLRKFISMYFKNPEIDQTGRGLIVKNQVYLFDGKSTKRLGDVLLSNLT